VGDAPWGVVPALLIATAVYGLFAWYRRRWLGHPGCPRDAPPRLCQDEGIWAR
jgi:hypothetical protein